MKQNTIISKWSEENQRKTYRKKKGENVVERHRNINLKKTTFVV